MNPTPNITPMEFIFDIFEKGKVLNYLI